MAEEKESVMNIKVLEALGEDWIKISDLLAWLRVNQAKDEHVSIHWIIKSIVKMKNSTS